MFYTVALMNVTEFGVAHLSSGLPTIDLEWDGPPISQSSYLLFGMPALLLVPILSAIPMALPGCLAGYIGGSVVGASLGTYRSLYTHYPKGTVGSNKL